MKILFCDNGLATFLNFRGGVVRYFHESGHEVVVAVPQSTSDSASMTSVPDYLQVYPLPLDRNGANPLSDLRFYYALYKLIQEVKPHVVFTYTIKPNIYGSFAARRLGIPVVAMVAGLGYTFSGNSIKHRLGRLLYKHGLRNADKVIVLNRNNLDTLRDNSFVKEQNLILFEGGEGVNLMQFPLVHDDYKNVRFLMVARVLYDKGYTEFVEAARIVKEKYPQIQFDLLGPLATDSPMGVPTEVVKSDVASGAINYLGETNNVASFVALNGVVVVVSSYHEGFNRSLMEACAMGRICITSNIPGCAEIVEDGYNGYLVQPKNSKELASAMIHVIESSEETRQRLAANSYKKAREYFDIQNVYRQYDLILKQIFK